MVSAQGDILALWIALHAFRKFVVLNYHLRSGPEKLLFRQCSIVRVRGQSFRLENYWKFYHEEVCYIPIMFYQSFNL